MMTPLVESFSGRVLPATIPSRVSPVIAKVYTTSQAPPTAIPPSSTPVSAPAKSWPPNINTDYEALWPIIALRHTPPGPSGDCVAPRGTAWSGAWVKQLCVARNVYYAGNCAQSGQAAGQTASLATKGVALAGQTGTTVAEMVAAGSAAIPVIGLGIAAITSIIGAIFAHHAQAVANEQEAECAVYAAFGSAVPQIDAAVQSGQITAAQGIAAHQQVVTQCKAILAPVQGVGSSGHPCNAGCCFGYWLDCLQDFASTYYNDLTPPVAAPVAPPQSAPVQPTGGSMTQTNLSGTLSAGQIAASVAPSPAVNPPTSPSSAYQASVPQAIVQDVAPPGGSPSTGISSGTTGIIFVVLLVVLLVIAFGKST